jgi:transposase
MKAYSEDLRQRIVKAVLSGQSERQVAQTFAVSHATVKRLVKQYQTTGHLTPKARPGRPRQIQATQHELLKNQWQKQPDAKLEWHCEECTRITGVKVSRSTMCRMLKRLGWRRQEQEQEQEQEQK